MKRVPIQTPCAPKASAAARPRPSTMLPAATTGIETASTICGISAMPATWPVCPPASVPCATTTSQPACSAATAWLTLPHMLITSRPASWHLWITGRGTPRPAMNALAPSSMITSIACIIESGSAASRSTPKGFCVRSRTRRISRRMPSGPSPAMPSVPKPPASETAAHTSA